MAEHFESLASGEEPIDEPRFAEDQERSIEQGIALCLSGGGYRAMLFHVGGIWRLNELRLLDKLKRVSSVSGGSITAAKLALNWSNLRFEGSVARNLQEQLVEPIREMSRVTVDVSAVGWGILNPFRSIAEQVAGYYDEHLFQGATLQSLPESPRFVINATNVKSGAVWRFSRPYMGDWKTGLVRAPNERLASAVAASSAFPPFLSPMKLDVGADRFDPDVPAQLKSPEYRDEIVLTDGGVYDNLGLETAFKRYDTLLVSDGGRAMASDPDPSGDWAGHSYRLIELLQHQTSSLRRRQLIDAYKSDRRKGAYWGIQTDIRAFGLDDHLPADFQRSIELGDIPTRLSATDDQTQRRLINWGYAISDAAIRRFFPIQNATPPSWPYPDIGV